MKGGDAGRRRRGVALRGAGRWRGGAGRPAGARGAERPLLDDGDEVAFLDHVTFGHGQRGHRALGFS
jgi:hypothetical protein